MMQWQFKQSSYSRLRVINYARNILISSKLLLEEDFEKIFAMPEIHLTPSKKNPAAIMTKVSFSVLGTLVSAVYSKYFLAIGLLPFAYEGLQKLHSAHTERYHKKVVRQFVVSLETLFLTTKEIAKSLCKQNAIYESLGEKLSNVELIESIEKGEVNIANKICQHLHFVCEFMQNSLDNGFTFTYYKNSGRNKIETPTDFANLKEAINFIDYISDFYLLLASNMLEFSFVCLQSSHSNEKNYPLFWKQLANFTKVIEDINDQIRNCLCCKRLQLKENKPKINREPLTEAKPEHDSIVYDCLFNIEAAFKIVSHLKTKKLEKALLTEALHQLSLAADCLKVLLRTNSASFKPISKESIESLDSHIIKHLNDEISDPSDDEEFQYSPESHSECEERTGINFCHDDDVAALEAAQRLIIEELLQKMKKLKRVKVFKQSKGGLVAQERESTMDLNTDVEVPASVRKTKAQPILDTTTLATTEDWFVMPKTVEPPPLPPPPPNKFTIAPAESSFNENDNKKSMLEAITNIAKQNLSKEEVFACETMET